MHLTRESEYALKALAFLAVQPALSVITQAEIAEATGLPGAFLAKILHKLTRSGLLVATRGPGNGYVLARPPGSITLREVLESVEGAQVFQHCWLWQGRCGDVDPCPLHDYLKAVLPPLASVFDEITLERFAERAGDLDVAIPRASGGGS
ncbi:MAG: RrF2 family transcriptional regulator [Gemmatimonadales bacterium]